MSAVWKSHIGAHSHFNFSAPSLLYLAIVASICSFLLCNSLSICDATCSSGKTRLCRGCTSFSPCTRSCYNVHALVISESLNVFDHIFAAEAGFNSLLQLVQRLLTMELVLILTTIFILGDIRGAYIKLLMSKAADKTISKFEVAFLFTLKDICSRLQNSPPKEKEFLMLETFPHSTTRRIFIP